MNITNKVVEYFRTSQIELKKVIWPSKKETTRYSILVIGMSLVVAVFFGILDYIFNLGLTQFISR